MRQPQPATVYKFECLTTVCVVVTVDPVIHPFLRFCFVFGVQMSMIWTIPEQKSRSIRCAWSPSSPCPIHSFIKRCAFELRPIQFFRPLPFFRFPLPLHMREVRRLPRPSGGPCGGPVAFRDLKFAKERLIFGQICSGFLLRSDPPK